MEDCNFYKDIVKGDIILNQTQSNTTWIIPILITILIKARASATESYPIIANKV